MGTLKTAQQRASAAKTAPRGLGLDFRGGWEEKKGRSNGEARDREKRSAHSQELGREKDLGRTRQLEEQYGNTNEEKRLVLDREKAWRYEGAR